MPTNTPPGLSLVPPATTADELRHENARLRARVAGLEAENAELKRALDTEPVILQRGQLSEITGLLAQIRNESAVPAPPSDLAVPIDDASAPIARGPLPRQRISLRGNGDAVRPHSPGEDRAKGGRPRNEKLWAYLKAGHYERERNDEIAKKFGVSENTVRRIMWEMGVKRTKQIRRPKSKRGRK